MIYFTTWFVVSLYVSLTNCFKITITPTFPANLNPIELESIEGKGGEGIFGKVIFATNGINKFAVKYVSQVPELGQSEEKFAKRKASQEKALRNERKVYGFMNEKSGGHLPRGIPKLHYCGSAKFEVDKDHAYEVLVIDYFPHNLTEVGDLLKVKRKYFSESTICRVTRELIETLTIFQTWGMVHQDLKPDNIMIGSDSYPRIIDYGLSVCEGGDTQTIKGTPLYQRRKILARTSGPTPRSDLAALVTTMVDLKIGHSALIKKVEARECLAPDTDSVTYKHLGKLWWLPYSRSKFNRIIMSAFKSTESLETVILNMNDDAENGDDAIAVPYDEYAAQLV